MAIDLVSPFLVPISVQKTETGMILSAGNETVTFSGSVFCFKGVSGKSEIAVKGNTVVAHILPEKSGTVEEYGFFDGIWSGCREIVKAETDLSGICVFLRCKTVSFYLSLDFPYCRIKADEHIAYTFVDPNDEVKPGEKYKAYGMSVGAVRLTGSMSDEFDFGEIEGFSAYIQSRMPVNFRGERPITSSTCITNRMTDVREGRIFYSMYDNPTLTLDPETLKEEVRLCAELGIEYYQLFEGYFDWEDDGSSERNLKEIVALGKKLGVRVGDYMTALQLNCWHYNYRDRTVTDQKLLSLSENGERTNLLCYGNPDTVKMLKKTILESISRNGEEMICLDGDIAVPCYDADHPHAPGSYFGHIRGMIEFMQAMNDVSPYFLTWSNAGNWIEFMPKLLWYNQNVYLTDPHPRGYESSLNMLKYFGDCRREQMVTVHEKYFVPYTAFTNCEYYHAKHSRVADEAFFEYSFLQGLCVTPNICLGELRTFLERIPAKSVKPVKQFMKKWIAFIKDNIDCWKNTIRIGDRPGVGYCEAYLHRNGNRGFICLVNQDHYSKIFKFTADENCGFPGKPGERYLLSEVYPGEYPIAEQTLPGLGCGESVELSVPPYSVRIIAIKPYTETGSVRIYGAKANLLPGGQYEITESNGKVIPMAIWCPEGSYPRQVIAKTAVNVPKYEFPTTVCDFAASGRGMRFCLRMPRDRFDPEIRLWSVDGSEETALRIENSDFLGAVIHNLYDEKTRTYLTLLTGCEPTDDLKLLSPRPKPLPILSKIPRRAAHYRTTFTLPFIEWQVLAPPIGYDEVMELVFKNSTDIETLEVQINGRTVPVYAYRSAMQVSYCVELIGEVASGQTNTFDLYITWKRDNNTPPATKKKKNAAGGPMIISAD